MVSMIIVEDESFERKSLMNCIDWGLIGVEIVGDASNGEAGLALVRDKHPDIVLTDINMPIMNAIEMSARIRQINSDIKILFISSYDDFEYAKQAIELKIFSYITKPVNEAELLRTVKRAVDSITEKLLEDKIYSNMKSNYKKGLLLIREALFLRILMGAHVEIKEVEKANLNWLFYQNEENLCLFHILYENTDQNAIDRQVENLTEECRQTTGQIIAACYYKGSILMAAGIKKKDTEDLLAALEQKINSFLAANGFENFRIEREYTQNCNRNIAQLYEALCQKGLLFGEQLSSRKNKKKQSKQEIVSEIEKIIKEKYDQPLSIEGIAKMMFFTPNYIGMIFKNLKKISINHYLTHIRLEAAEKLLADTDLTVNEIALNCGFDNVTYFHTLFKKERGATPSEFRNSRYQNEDN